MIKEPFTSKYYSFHSKLIENVLSLRDPQRESLEIFARLCDTISLSKHPDLDIELEAVHKLCPTLTSFERHFPSFCFALATGIGKTRLMGACMAYLCYEKGIKNFFVMAPNLTIYNKLKSDFGDVTNPKYVFKGLDLFAQAPIIINGDNYAEFRQTKDALFASDITINIFNIAKLNAESKGKAGQPARIKRLNEVLGESYFEYLQSLPDLCIFMDESHHYHADKSFEVINELQPILGVEMTATPQIQKRTKAIPFKNVVYEYSLAHALNDERYVKVPVVFTKKNFRPEEYTDDQLDHIKLIDGLRIHEETKSQLEVYARNHEKPIVKPFVLVVAKDTTHSKKLMSFIKSKDFFNGYYADKVMEINSDQKKSEKDENIERLLALEKPYNKIEIVIHVNMLKEGWDVTNLYTIIPLRASASETLTEQTIGRGLRLPYGERTGVDEVDRLSIISHDKYAEIINKANQPDSLVRKVYYIEDTDIGEHNEPRETVELPSTYVEETTGEDVTTALTTLFIDSLPTDPNDDSPSPKVQKVVEFITSYTSGSVMEAGKHIPTLDAIHDKDTRDEITESVITETIQRFPTMNLTPDALKPVVTKAIDTCVQTLTSRVIPIPRAVVQPFTNVKQGFTPFTLNTSGMNWHPSDDTLLGTELRENGRTFEMVPGFAAFSKVDTPENEVVRHIIIHDNVDYEANADLIYSLIDDAKQHFLSYLTEEDAEKVMRERQKTLADMIYAQMNQHFYHEEVSFRASKMQPFTKIETSFGGKFSTDDIYNLQDTVPPSEIRNKIFRGFKKACHTLYKFDSATERDFAIILENDSKVLRWMRPAPKQFSIYYGPGGIHKYEPDFIVETADTIYMVETKARKDLETDPVKQKATAAKVYCQAVSEWNGTHGGKPWEYALIPHDDVRINSSFKYLIDNRYLKNPETSLF